MSVNLIEEVSNTKKQKLEKYNGPTLTDYDQSEEEQAYLKFIHADEAEVLPEDAEVLPEDWHEPMGHSISSKLQLNVYHNSPADLECYASMATLFRPSKKAKTRPTLSTITLGMLNSKKNSFKLKHQKRV